jgi:uncharacterized protein (TIGR02646 family)
MIKVARANEPAILQINAAAWKANYLAAKAALAAAKTKDEIAQAKKAKNDAEKKYNHPQVKTALNTMFNGGKCAYCESHIAHISYPHIEHYRPKDSYPDECFSWKNLLLGCGVCNGKGQKGTKFPKATDGGFLINPCDDDPDDFFDFVCTPDAASEEGFFAKVIPKNPRGVLTEKILGLNRPTLLRKRTQSMVPYFLRLAQLAGEGDAESIDLLKKWCNPRFEFSAFAKSLYKQFVDKT